MGFSRQEYWSGLPFPSPEDLPNPGIEPGSPELEADALLSEPAEGTNLEVNKCKKSMANFFFKNEKELFIKYNYILFVLNLYTKIGYLTPRMYQLNRSG